MWIAAAIGAAIGAASFIYGNWKKNEEIERRKEQVLAQGKEKLELMDMEWEQSVREANRVADKTDTETTLSEAMLGSSPNGTLRSLGMQQEASTFGYNAEAVGTGTSEGAANESAAQGGTRGSSALQTAAMGRDASNAGLQVQEDYDRLSGDLTLMGAMNSVLGGAQEIQRARTDARETRESYAEGGEQWNIYQKQRVNYVSDVIRAYDDLDAQKIDAFSPEWIVDVHLGALSGASTGLSIGSKIGEYKANWQKPQTVQSEASASTVSGYGGETGWSSAFGSSFKNLSPVQYGTRLA